MTMARRAFDAFANEKGESDKAVLFVVDEGSDHFVRDLNENRWRLGLKFIPRRVHHHSMMPHTVYTPGAPSFAEDTNKKYSPPIVEDTKKYSPPSPTNVKNAKKGKKNMNVKKHMKGKKAKKQINGKKDKKQRSVIH